MDTEKIWHEGSKIIVDYDNDKIYITSIGDFDVAKALRCKEFIYKIFDKTETRFDMIIDISNEGKSASGTWRVWKQINAHPKVRYVALCGVNSFAKVVNRLLVGFKQHSKCRLFTDKSEALDWVNTSLLDVKRWFDAKKDKLPENNQEVLILVDGVNYISKFEAHKKLFRVENELKETVFSAEKNQIFWTQKKHFSGKQEYFKL